MATDLAQVDSALTIGYEDADVPWFILPFLQYEPGSWESRTRYMFQRGMRPSQEYLRSISVYDIWKSIIGDAYSITGKDKEQWPEQIEKIRATQADDARHAAMTSPRAFCDFAGMVDDSGSPLLLKDFHVRSILHMRQTDYCLLLLPAYHGKSFLSSIVVPLMDWCEQPECTQIRIYEGENFSSGYARQLMGIVENNDAMHQLFPLVSKPNKGDPAYKDWGVERFSIRGKTQGLQHPSFRPLTWASETTGVRADRTGGDDWVNDGNDDSPKIQERQINYFKSGVMTMKTVRPWKSRFGTKWGNVFLVGTIFHKQDVNSRLQREWKGKKDRKVIRIDVFPRKGSEQRGEVIWPEYRTFQFVQELKAALGERAFNMRMRNLAQGNEDSEKFPEEKVRGAISDTDQYGVVPDGGWPLIIGFDPGSGKRTAYAKYPAIVLLAIYGEEVHFVAWERMRGKPFPSQVDTLIQWAKIYNCPIAVEENHIQTAYGEQIKIQAPGIRIFSHTTNANKRDPKSGVEQFIPLFQNEKITIHGKGATNDQLYALTSEFIDWDQAEFSDLVMASWIAKRQFDLRMRSSHTRGYNTLPEYVGQRGHFGGSFIDISHLKGGQAQP